MYILDGILQLLVFSIAVFLIAWLISRIYDDVQRYFYMKRVRKEHDNNNN